MKTIKSKKWYQNQIETRRNAVRQLALSIDDPGICATPLRLEQAAEYNRPIQSQCAAIYSEINALESDFTLYYRK